MNEERFRDMAALVTGASSGIGRAISLAYARLGGSVVLCGRSKQRLETVAREVKGLSVGATVSPCDFTNEADVRRLCEQVQGQMPRLDLLVHAAGHYVAGRVSEIPAAELDTLYAVNVRAPYVLTRELLPLMVRTRGQVVFINSSVVFGADPGVAAYAMTKHALRGFADHLRAEVNEEGIRVLSVFPGRTATPMQERIYADVGRAYAPERLLQPEDVAMAVIDAVSLPPTAELTELRVRPRMKS